jgi:predicted O-methyltransferase YrrM
LKRANFRIPPKVTTIRQGYVLAVLANAEGWQRFAELGVRRGATAELMLRFAPGVEYVGVDAWQQVEGDPSEPGYVNYGLPDMEDWKRRTAKALRAHADRVRLVEASTVEAAKLFPPAYFDAVFIDADHRTPYVLADIDAWRPLVRPGGWLIGHDWNWPSVKAAVLERLGEPRVLAPNVWGVRA